MIIFAIVVIIVLIAIACVGLVCALVGSEELRKMGIRF